MTRQLSPTAGYLPADPARAVPQSGAGARPWLIRRRLVVLALLTLAGAILRFAALDRPVLWGDEALTYSRVIGTYDQMLAILRNDGFLPLHYTLYWLLAQVTELTPAVMRLIPALCGTLMVPAIYFAARQVASVRAALLAAAFACCSAYLVGYSHDAKMYMQTWLMVALSLGCWWWWLRTRSSTAWLAWIAASLGAISFHISAVLLLIPQPLFLLTARRAHWRQGVLMLLGAIIIALGPAGYYIGFNQWSENTGGIVATTPQDAGGQWSQSGLQWVEDHNRGATGPTLLRESTSAYLLGYAWPATERRFGAHNPAVRRAGAIACITLLALCALAAFSWRRRRQSPPLLDPPAEPWWRNLLWLGLAMIIPVYGFYYCRSVDAFASPFDWWQGLGALPAGWKWTALVAAALLLPVACHLSAPTWSLRLTATVQLVLVVAALLLVCAAAHAFWQAAYLRHWASMQAIHGASATPLTRPDLDWMSLWTPRYAGIIWPALALAVSMMLLRLPTRPLRWGAITCLLAVNLIGAVARQVVGTEAPLDRVFADVAAARESAGRTRVIMSSLDDRRWGVDRWFHSSAYGLYGSAGKYYACITLDLDVTPQQFRDGTVTYLYRPWVGELVMPEQIRRSVNRRLVVASQTGPAAERLVIWERYVEHFPRPEELPADDRILRALGDEWRPAGAPEIFWLRNHHHWSDMGWTRRREFVRAPAPPRTE